MLACRHQREIVVLFGERNEVEIGRMRDWRDGHALIGTALGHGCCNCVVGARLVPVAVRARVTEEPIN